MHSILYPFKIKLLYITEFLLKHRVVTFYMSRDIFFKDVYYMLYIEDCLLFAINILAIKCSANLVQFLQDKY